MNEMARAEALDGGLSVAESKARLRLWLKILKAFRMIDGELRERLRGQFATTLPRFDVMAALYRHADGLKMSGLSGVLRVSNGNVTGIVDRLVSEGMIVRVPVEGDRRAMMVRLTARGRDAFETMAREHEAWVAEMMGEISIEETEMAIKALTHITNRASFAEDEAQ